MPRPPPRTAREAPLTNVAIGALATIIGRVEDRVALADRFDEGARLVTVVGHGGIGKTRLALAFAEEQLAAYSGYGDGGVWFCELAEATSIVGICARVASALGLRLEATNDPGAVVDQIARALARRGRLLVVMDNFEHLTALASATLGVFLAKAPTLRVLVTSRVALDLPEEQRWPLGGLDPPSRVDLFVRRARQVRPDLHLDERALAAIGAIVSRLEGIPLAIELAAARSVALSPMQIRDRLASREADVLVRPGDEGRHGSMRAVVAESFRLLGDRDRACLVASVVFHGGFTLDAAEAVIFPDESAIAPLESLVAHSLLRITSPPDGEAQPRFSLYEVIRDFARGELDRDPAHRAALERRHAAYFARAYSRSTPETPADLAHDLENVLRALSVVVADASRSREPARALEALALARAADPVLVTRGLLATRLKVLDDAIATARAIDPELPGIAVALMARGHTQAELGAFDTATDDLEDVLVRSRTNGDAELEALAHVRLGSIVETRGSTDAARERFATAIACATRASLRGNVTQAEAEARAALAHAYRREGRLDDADRELATATAGYRALGNLDAIAAMVFEAGVLALFRERYSEASARFDEALALARRLQLRHREASVLTAQGTMHQELGELERARELHEAALVLFRDAGTAYSEASTIYYLAGAQLERGQSNDAAALFASALRIVRVLGVPRYEALICGTSSTLHADAGDEPAALVLAGEAERAASHCQSEPTLLATLAIHAMHRGLRAKSADARDALVDEARALAARWPCDDPRFALRLLQRAVNVLAETSQPIEAPLVVRREGRAFRLPGATEDVALERRIPLARILHALARRRIESPGEAMRVEELLAAGWPAEKVRYDAGANRVYVALAELRKRGLREFIESGAEGYRLATSRSVVLDGSPHGR